MKNNTSKNNQQTPPPRAGRDRKHARYDLPVIKGVTRAKLARKLV